VQELRKNFAYCLGIESTADDFSGIHPREAARHHAQVAGDVLEKAFQKAGIKPKEITVVAFSQGPGLGPCLRTGATASRALASYLNVPLVGVNHCVAHIEIAKLIEHAKDPVTLYVSGGNTLVTAFEANRYRVFGETLDIAVGNCLDVFAREAGFRQKEGLPFGAIIERLATKGKELIPLPYVVKGMDLSYSGLLTAATQQFRKGTYRIEDLCYSLQEVTFSMLTEVTERALAHTEKPEALLTGGVAANKRLQSMINSIAEEHNAKFSVVPKEYALDNGAMIAWTGILAYKHGLKTPIEKSFVRLKWRLEEVHVPWVVEG
jgi:universal protein Kae1